MTYMNDSRNFPGGHSGPNAQPATPDAGYVPLTGDDMRQVVNSMDPWHAKWLMSDWRCVRLLARAIEREVLSRVQAVRKPLTEDARDAARLDWIARQDLDDLAFGLVQDAPHDGEYVINAGNGPYYGRTLRAAIDAAMQGEQQ